MNSLKKLYLVGVRAVLPENLMPKWLIHQGNKLQIGDLDYALRDTYVVGFGKAVASMIPHIQKTLKTPEKNYMKEGILSVPVGYLDSDHNLRLKSYSRIKVYEGAEENLPDLAAQRTAEKVMELVGKLSERDLLFVLISGGGSALLPMPVPPLTLEEKTQIIRDLSRAGASIYELNTVRRVISVTKGGNLARKTKAKIVSFILSDTIGNSFDVIASGPTVPNTDPPEAPVEVLRKYNIPLTNNLNQVLRNRFSTEVSNQFPDVNNVLIGSNTTAIQCIYDTILAKEELQCTPFILTSCLQGMASTVGKIIAQFSFGVLERLYGNNPGIRLESFAGDLCTGEPALRDLESWIDEKGAHSSTGAIACLLGGETMVQVKGNGTGGRNQEMVLAASLEIERLSRMRDTNGEILLLSGGTDGIDGSTDAAGAITYFSRNGQDIRLQTQESREQGLNPEVFLADNNSYEYFSKLSNGEYLLKPSHTGTNVMDIQLLLIKKLG